MCTVWSARLLRGHRSWVPPCAPTGNPRLWPERCNAALRVGDRRALVRGRLQAEGSCHLPWAPYTIGIASLIGSGRAGLASNRRSSRATSRRPCGCGCRWRRPSPPCQRSVRRTAPRRFGVASTPSRSRGRGRPPRDSRPHGFSSARSGSAGFPPRGSADRRDGHADARTAVPSCGDRHGTARRVAAQASLGLQGRSDEPQP